MRMLIVEDEETLAATLARGLRRKGIAVDVAHDGEKALEKASINRYDVILLDRDLPLIHGDDVCRSLMAEVTTARILMLTAAGDINERVEGLSIGADDYLPKPFAFAELLARVQALGRRAPTVTPPVLRRGDVVLDRGRRRALRAGSELMLTRKELSVLELLLEADGAVVSAEDLLERAWDEHVNPFTSVVRVTVMNLRRKLGKPPVVETVVGQGYRAT